MSFTLNQHDPRENVDIYPEDQRKVRMERTNQAFTSLTNFVQLATIGGFDSVGTHPSGTGKFGCVHLVKNKVNQQFCVMKVLNKIDTIRMKQVDHTKNELEVLVLKSSLKSTRLASYSDNNNLYFCLEFCPGGELFKLLREVGRFNQKTTAFYAAEILLAFEFLHEKNIAYRDLKPENVLIGADGHLKLCDFGFAKHIEDRSWTLCGTPEYLPPEIILGKGHDKSVDWWSYGVFIFELLAGYAPFYGQRPIDIYDKILAGIDSVTFPNFLSAEARDLIRRFLTSRSRRLGNTRGGIRDIKTHPFFITINWAKIAEKGVAPPAVPNLLGEGDRTNFDVVHDAPAKFNMFNEEDSDEDSHVHTNKAPLSPPSRISPPSSPSLVDLTVFDDWPTNVYV